MALIIFYPTYVANGFVIRLENLSRHLNDSLIFIIELAFSCYNTIIQTAYCAQNCTVCVIYVVVITTEASDDV